MKKKRSVEKFVAKGSAAYRGHQATILLSGSYSSLRTEPVELIISPDNKKTLGLDEQQPIAIEAHDENGEDIRVFNLSKISTTFSSVETGEDVTHYRCEANLFVRGQLSNISPSKGQVKYFVFVPFTPLAESPLAYEFHHNGTIAFAEKETAEAKRQGNIRWSSKTGNCELIDNYEYLKDEDEDDQATVRIQRCQIVITRETGDAVSFADDLSGLQKELADPLWLLSFLGRKRLNWYAAEAHFYPDEPGAVFRRAVARRNVWLGLQPALRREDHEIPVKVERLRSGLFQQLLNKYVASPLRDKLRQTIVNLLIFYESTYLDAQVGSSYSALECLVNGLSNPRDSAKEFLIPPSTFGPICGNIAQLIRKEVPDLTAAESLISRLENINRKPVVAEASLRDRLLTLAMKYDLDLKCFWPPSADVGAELKGIIDRRDIYIHQGRIDSDRHLYDIYRLRGITEFLLLKVLGCSNEDLNPRAIESEVPLTR